MSNHLHAFLRSSLYRRFFCLADWVTKIGWTVGGLFIAAFVIHSGSTYTDPFDGQGLLIPLLTVVSGIVIAITGVSISTRVGLAEVLGIERPVQQA